MRKPETCTLEANGIKLK